ncbi:hypothetical protein TBLA_0I03340 [Henningerozyma blattae CBS 6284]|uniref:Uncharacterized protein n=1 Tax=Henningerozyma blattae (strain ATCC 34711 / CBS 6284 / DSM 70876 / NBRC 10599 / NRRL Y-10934 / UCD 77-7) TaxID=1071380 RepID=I2H9D7_HENB6|nr:hypothetical protein TBLA_0I03340 [Tetrapisispora blattae CBS 6284]CCH62989.1 hypothetical protein TBLA_0I03340 [Tetrapisispora blattae CBS 6284]
MSNEGISQEVIELFENENINSIRDYHNELNHKVSKLKIQLDKELLNNYNEILKVTESFDSILNSMKIADNQFRSLCFDDEQFKLNKLKEPILNKLNLSEEEKNELKRQDEIDLNNNNESLLVLKLADWSFVIDEFIDCINKNNAMLQHDTEGNNNNAGGSSTNNLMSSQEIPKIVFEKVNQMFCNLESDIISKIKNNGEYCQVLNKSCSKFLKNVEKMEITNFDINQLTNKQWIEMYNILHLDEYPWDQDKKLHERVIDKIFDKLLITQRDINILLKCTNEPIITQFINSEEFKKRLAIKTRDDLQIQLTRLERVLAEKPDGKEKHEGEDILYPYDSNRMPDVKTILNKANLNSNGLGNSQRSQCHELIIKLLELLKRLKDLNETDDEIINKLERLHKQMLDTTQSKNKEHVVTGETMDHVVAQVLSRYQNHQFSNLLEKQLVQLQDLAGH